MEYDGTTDSRGSDELAGPDSLPEDLLSWIDSLKKKELQHELRGRELNTTGLKDELRERLIQSMVEERQAAAKTAAFSKQDAKRAPVEEDAQQTKPMDISVDKNDVIPVEKALGGLKVHDNGRGDEDESRPMETDELMPPPKSAPKECEATDSRSMKEAYNEMKSSGIENDSPVSENSTKNSAAAEGKVDDSRPLSQTKQLTCEPRTSRSPLRFMQPSSQSALKTRMQNTVQSALRNLRPVSPKKTTTEESKQSPPKPKKQIVVLPQTLSTDETESSSSSASETGFSSTAAPPAPVVPVPGSTRPYLTPAVSTSSGTSKIGGLGINSDSSKAKNDARMARIAEMRNKVSFIPHDEFTIRCRRTLFIIPLSLYKQSKPVTSTAGKPLGIPVLGSLKSSALKPTSNTKRQLLTSQMREKAFGRLGEAATTNIVAPSSSVAPQQQAQSAVSSNESDVIEKKNKTPPPSAKQARSPVLSPLDTYDMSDHGGDSDTDEEVEYERRKGKRVPGWAQKENLKQALQRQYTDNSVDPDDLFGEVTTCNLEAIFGRKKTKYQKRTSSGNWTRDRATVAEKLAFKRQMGYAVKA